MNTISLEVILVAVSPGGGSCLSSVTELTPAGGPHTSVAPAKFAGPRGQEGVGVYAYEKRYLDGELRTAVLIDSKQSQLNRAEAGLELAILDGHPMLSRMPRIVVSYQAGGREETYSDLTLPHRAFDGHIRAGTSGGQPVTDLAVYKTMRDASPANARALLEGSPITLVYGGWDASRRSRQGRWRSALVGEVIGFCQQEREPVMRGGARVDPVGMQMQIPGDVLQKLVERQSAEMSGKSSDKIIKAATTAAKDKKLISASAVGLGGVPPSLGQLAGVACDRIVRSSVLSFATLRQMRFGAGPAGDQACRALLAALALNGLARADAELYLRANCDLIEADVTKVEMDQRYGRTVSLAPLGIKEADELLAEALAHAEREAGVRWEGQVLAVDGDPQLLAAAESVDADGKE